MTLVRVLMLLCPGSQVEVATSNTALEFQCRTQNQWFNNRAATLLLPPVYLNLQNGSNNTKNQGADHVLPVEEEMQVQSCQCRSITFDPGPQQTLNINRH